jgi:hypothetical protein
MSSLKDSGEADAESGRGKDNERLSALLFHILAFRKGILQIA